MTKRKSSNVSTLLGSVIAIAYNSQIDAMRILYNQLTMVLYKYCVLRILYN